MLALNEITKNLMITKRLLLLLRLRGLDYTLLQVLLEFMLRSYCSKDTRPSDPIPTM
jgi:hypothetical protein